MGLVDSVLVTRRGLAVYVLLTLEVLVCTFWGWWAVRFVTRKGLAVYVLLTLEVLLLSRVGGQCVL